MNNDTDIVVDRLPNPNILPVPKVLSYENISGINLMLNANTASVHSNLGDGTHIHLVFFKSQTQYATIFNTIFVVPTNPGTQLMIPVWECTVR